MQTATFPSVEAKTLELCEAIVSHPEFAAMFQKLDAFMSDEGAKYEFQSLNDLGQLLQQKQASGLTVTDEEIETFETLRGSFMGKAIARDFLDAQEQVQRIQSGIYKQLSKTFEVGRVPVADDFADECCSSGCGCH